MNENIYLAANDNGQRLPPIPPVPVQVAGSLTETVLAMVCAGRPTREPSWKRHAQQRRAARKERRAAARVLRACPEHLNVLLDPFSGSGTTGIADIKQAREYLGFELDYGYATPSERRLRAAAAPCASTTLPHIAANDQPPAPTVGKLRKPDDRVRAKAERKRADTSDAHPPSNAEVAAARCPDQPTATTTPFRLFHSSALDVLKTLPDNSLDSCVTDPPYGIGFMNKAWDAPENIAFSAEFWREVLRVLKPGAHLLAFSAPRTYHRMVVAIEDAGFNIRDQIAWLHGQGMPKSRDFAKDIDRMAGAKREVVGTQPALGYTKLKAVHGVQKVNTWTFSKTSAEPVTAEAAQWHGWGTGLKPAMEPIVVAQKPLNGSYAANALAHGVGGLNVDACRVGNAAPLSRSDQEGLDQVAKGRWPANVIHDGSEGVIACLPATKPARRSKAEKALKRPGNAAFGGWLGTHSPANSHEDDGGSAARFFYCAKPSKREKGETSHVTVKPVELMKYLCRLVTPPGGTVLDPFAGSGTTGVAALAEGFVPVLIEREAEYVADIERRTGLKAA